MLLSQPLSIIIFLILSLSCVFTGAFLYIYSNNYDISIDINERNYRYINTGKNIEYKQIILVKNITFLPNIYYPPVSILNNVDLYQKDVSNNIVRSNNKIIHWNGQRRDHIEGRKRNVFHCISGHIRTFIRPEIYTRIKSYLIDSFNPNDTSDVVIILDNSEIETEKGDKDERFSDITLDAALSHIKPLEVFFQGNTQASKWYTCMRYAKYIQKKYGFQYEYFIRSRPDLLWLYPIHSIDYISKNYSNDTVVCYNDIIAVIQPALLSYWGNIPSTDEILTNTSWIGEYQQQYYHIDYSPSHNDSNLPLCKKLDFPFIIWRYDDVLGPIWISLKFFEELWYTWSVTMDDYNDMAYVIRKVDQEFAIFCDRARDRLDHLPPVPAEWYLPIPPNMFRSTIDALESYKTLHTEEKQHYISSNFRKLSRNIHELTSLDKKIEISDNMYLLLDKTYYPDRDRIRLVSPIFYHMIYWCGQMDYYTYQVAGRFRHCTVTDTCIKFSGDVPPYWTHN